MLIGASERAFEAHLARRGTPFAAIAAAAALAAMIDWYESERADDALSLDDEGDMLLFQWAIHDGGEGERFEIGLTRQFIAAPGDEYEDEDVSEGYTQLSATFLFEPTKAMREIPRGHHWCHGPADVAAFRTLVDEHPATRSVEGELAVDRELRLEDAG